MEASLQDVLITHELISRSERPPNPDTERLALEELAQVTAQGEEAILRKLCLIGLRYCQAGSCGINVIEEHDDEDHFRWLVIEGAMKPHQGNLVASSHSPCGYVVQRNSSQLFSNAARFFGGVSNIDLVRHESLIMPLHRGQNEIIGTMWIISHNEARRFDKEDLRILSVLGKHASAALRVHYAMYKST